MSHSASSPFGRLPTELRQKIWALSVWPRIISVSVGYELQKSSGQYRCLAQFSPAAILLVSRESRTVGLRLYQHSFHGQFRNPIYFHHEMDSLYMVNLDAMHAFYKATKEWQRLNAAADESSPVSMAFCVALHFATHEPQPFSDLSLFARIYEGGLVFPRLQWIIVTGYDHGHWSSTELLERLQVSGKWELGRHQLLDGKLVQNLQHLPPKVLFSLENFRLWISEKFV